MNAIHAATLIAALARVEEEKENTYEKFQE